MLSLAQNYIHPNLVPYKIDKDALTLNRMNAVLPKESSAFSTLRRVALVSSYRLSGACSAVVLIREGMSESDTIEWQRECNGDNKIPLEERNRQLCRILWAVSTVDPTQFQRNESEQ